MTMHNLAAVRSCETITAPTAETGQPVADAGTVVGSLPDGTAPRRPVPGRPGCKPPRGCTSAVRGPASRQADVAFPDDFVGLTQAEQIVLVQAVMREHGDQFTEAQGAQALNLDATLSAIVAG
jgi:hypothetical protein